MGAQQLGGGFGFKGVAVERGLGRDGGKLGGLVVGNEDFGGGDAGEFVEQGGEGIEFGEAEFAGAQVAVGEAMRIAALRERREEVRFPVIQAEVVERKAPAQRLKLVGHGHQSGHVGHEVVFGDLDDQRGRRHLGRLQR